MKISTQHQWLMIETTCTVLVGLAHTGAGILLTYLCLFSHIYYEQRQVPSSNTNIVHIQRQLVKTKQLPTTDKRTLK